MAIPLATQWHSIRGADLLLRLRIQPVACVFAFPLRLSTVLPTKVS
jgi:hypothetical protein